MRHGSGLIIIIIIIIITYLLNVTLTTYRNHKRGYKLI